VMKNGSSSTDREVDRADAIPFGGRQPLRLKGHSDLCPVDFRRTRPTPNAFQTSLFSSKSFSKLETLKRARHSAFRKILRRHKTYTCSKQAGAFVVSTT
jgi:hypothetical protein